MKTSIYINYFKDTARIESNALKPLHLGAINSKHDLNMLRDDGGTHISDKNKYYCELTGLYWAWKNDTISEHLGFFHYRRLFDFNHEKERTIGSDQLIHYHGIDDYLFEEFQITDEKINSLTDLYDAIIPFPFANPEGKTVKEQFNSSPHHHPQDLDLSREIIKELSPEFIDTFDNVMNGHLVHTTNMFILKRDIFDKLCSWLFNILDELHQRIDYSKYSHPQEERAIGYVAERLVSVFFFQEIINNPSVTYKELNRVFIKDTAVAPIEPDLPETSLPVMSIAISCDENYVPHLGALIASIVTNLSNKHYLDLIILDGGLSPMHRNLINKLLVNRGNYSINFLDMSNSYNDLTMHSFFTKATLFRLGLPDILKKRDKILFLDTDMVVTSDLSELYDTDLQGKYLAAAPDLIMQSFYNNDVSCPNHIYQGSVKTYLSQKLNITTISNYFQAGTLLLNLKQLRKDNKAGKMIDDINNNRYWYLDQDIFNKHLGHNIVLIDNKYNSIDMPTSHSSALNEEAKNLFDQSMADPHIVHFAGVGKPWLNNQHRNSFFYWYYLRMTMWYETIFISFIHSNRQGLPDEHINPDQRPKASMKKRLARFRRKYLQPITKP